MAESQSLYGQIAPVSSITTIALSPNKNRPDDKQTIQLLPYGLDIVK